MNEIRQKAHEIREDVIAFRRDLHMYPELSMEEFRTSDQVHYSRMQEFQEE